jgi:hypothetical protein
MFIYNKTETQMEDLLGKDLQHDTEFTTDPPKPIQFISLKSGKFAISDEAETFFNKLQNTFSSPNCNLFFIF